MQEKSSWFNRHPKKTFFFVYLSTLLCAEGALQTLKVHLNKTASRSEPIPYTYSRETYFDYTPNIRFTRFLARQDRHSPVANFVNSLAFRGPEVKEKSRYRVLILGDSFVEAEEIAFENTFGELLNRHFSGEIEFISKGISGWAPTTEFSWLYHKGIALKPDEVDMFLSENDFQREEANSKTDQLYRKKAVYQGVIPVSYNVQPGLDNKNHDVDPAFKSWLINHVQVIALVYRQLYSPLKENWRRKVQKETIVDPQSEMIFLAQDVSKWPADLKKNVDDTIQVVKHIHAFLKDKGIKLNLWVVPLGFAWPNESIPAKKAYHWDKEVTVSQEGIERYLQDVFMQAGIAYHSGLRTEFEVSKKLAPAKQLFLPADAHWNENGHAVVFEALRKHYQKRRYNLATKSSHNLTAP